MMPSAQNPSKRTFSVALTTATPLEQVLVKHLDTLPRTEQARRLLALAVQGYLLESRLLRQCTDGVPATERATVQVSRGFRLGTARPLSPELSGSTGNLQYQATPSTDAPSDAKPFAYLRSVIGG